VLQINLPNLFRSDTVCASIAFLLQEMTMYTTYDSYFVDHQPLLTKFIEFVCVPTLIKIITNNYFHALRSSHKKFFFGVIFSS
jgi:hypothetical protein